ncbi:unnamed protein product [Amoebophrya sp. A120]|nr:unnamed protein product [Amoebophrya sp. A120]|eukprot:GSA120T00020221001.1
MFVVVRRHKTFNRDSYRTRCVDTSCVGRSEGFIIARYLVKMDTATLNTIRKSIEKENKLNRKWADEALLRETLARARSTEPAPREEVTTFNVQSQNEGALKRCSSAEHYLCQKMGLVDNPFDKQRNRSRGSGMSNTGSTAFTNRKMNEFPLPGNMTIEDLLYFGVSCEGEGRHAYLKKRKAIDWQEKSRFPLLASQEVGWTVRELKKEPSAFARRPIVMNSFFRMNGVPLKMDAEKAKKKSA